MPVVLILQSVEGIMNASKEDLCLCPGLGPQKVSIIKKKKSERHKYTKKKQTDRTFFLLTVENMFVCRRGGSTMFCINLSSNPKTAALTEALQKTAL